jgi:hypothetical protein
MWLKRMMGWDFSIPVTLETKINTNSTVRGHHLERKGFNELMMNWQILNAGPRNIK